MNVICPSCSTVYRVDPAKVPERGVRARCRSCAAVFQVPAPADARPRASEPFQEAVPTPAPREVVEAAPLPPPPPPPPAPEPPLPAPVFEEPESRPAPEPAPLPRTTAPRGVTTGQPRPSVAIPPVAAPTRSSGSEAARPAAAIPPAPPPRPAPPAAATPPAGRRLVNPFMSQDPQQKARRLARALISDLVVYYPDRRQEGLRSGTLKEAFGEEIKKSWEEYRDQVGAEIAESTTYFNDALNDILAGGEKLW